MQHAEEVDNEFLHVLSFAMRVMIPAYIRLTTKPSVGEAEAERAFSSLSDPMLCVEFACDSPKLGALQLLVSAKSAIREG